MEIDFSQFTTLNNKNESFTELIESHLIEPRDLFMALPNKNKSYEYSRDVQTEVWKQWFEKRNEKNIIIKMNTGSGKTVVGLTILQSCLNEGKGPAVYIVPDNYLVQQVCLEAERLGIRVAKDRIDEYGNLIKGEDDYYFKMNKAILVANIHKLVNGKSVFGLRSGNQIEIGSIILDDVHACLDTIEQQHTIMIRPGDVLYKEITTRFSKYPEVNKSQSFGEIFDRQDLSYRYLVPFWIWQLECEWIYKKIVSEEYKEENFVIFNLPLMRDNWKTVNCVVTARGIELTLKGSPINKIVSFEKAYRRIFMSATLADDSVFVSTLGLNQDELSNIITPEKANDIGDRLILFPQFLNPQIQDEEIKQELSKVVQKHNVVVIVPSFERAKFWQSVNPNQVLSSRYENIESGISDLKNGKFIGLTILVNKYDGIDLPEDACRVLVIDGLPNMRSEYDMIIQEINPNDRRLYREQIQKIEQGMGRGVRSSNDYCVVVLMGAKLSDAIVNQHCDKFFSSATSKQLEISKKIWDQVMKKEDRPTVDKIFSLMKYSLERNPNWVSINKFELSQMTYNKDSVIDSFVVAMRKAYERECMEDYEGAFSILETEKNIIDDVKAKGLLMQYMAEYKNFTNPSQAQEILLAAREYNRSVLKPIDGIQFSKLYCSPDGQAANVYKYISKEKMKENAYILHVKSILSELSFSKDSSKRFEQALKNVFSIIGIVASRPELEYGGQAPDNLLALGQSTYAIIECKNGSTTDKISKSDCGQLLQSVQWFKNLYKNNDLRYYPVMIHNSYIFGEDASPSEDMRIMTPKLLDNFCNSVRKFSEAVVKKDVIADIEEIDKLLKQFNLNGEQIIKNYTREFVKK